MIQCVVRDPLREIHARVLGRIRRARNHARAQNANFDKWPLTRFSQPSGSGPFPLSSSLLFTFAMQPGHRENLGRIVSASLTGGKSEEE